MKVANDHPLIQCTPELTLRFLPSDEDQVIHLTFRWDYDADADPLAINIDNRITKSGSAVENWDSFCHMTRAQAELLHAFLGFVLASAKASTPRPT